jgi:hypothetical protein
MPKVEMGRREFLGLAAAGGAGLVIASGATAASAVVSADLVSGRVIEVDPSGLTVGPIDESSGPSHRVTSSDSTSFWRDGPASLDDFQRGDEVVAEGSWDSDGSFHADRLEILGRILKAEVEARGGWRRKALLHFAAALVGGIVAGSLLGGAGGLLSIETRVGLTTFFGVAAVGIGLAGAIGKSSWMPQCNRETAQLWMQYGPWWWAIRNGLALGLGVRTRIGFWLWFVIPGGAFLFGDPWFGGAVWGTYGASRGGFPALSILAARSRKDFTQLSDWLLSKRQLALRVSSGILVLVGTTAIVVVGL